ncbi:piggyBac transposable element-derived protein 3-like [Rhagoletis pomonella]|uniref:piggyBac transposable element-derived protein 3-like n=1 Tax=Rhagoletis pomonella TaxID=28610 RepID=UPI00177ACF8E|nr:piggyBac transposable element-derived protein 3-like [Rhagoletis pomonella]
MDENLSIDESMIPYYGRHYAKQYIRGKSIRFGFKNWALNSSDGYMLQFDVYMDKNAESVPQGYGVGGDKVVDLLTKANVPHHKGFKLFIDNYFTSVKLLRNLASMGICTSGTIRDGRIEKCPLRKIAAMKKEQRGSSDFRFTDDGWQDSRCKMER